MSYFKSKSQFIFVFLLIQIEIKNYFLRIQNKLGLF